MSQPIMEQLLSLSLSVVDRLSSDIIERLTMKKLEKHKEAMKRFDTELMQLTQVDYTHLRWYTQV